ncbi:MAG TPA: hypothetical protein VFQ61_19635 [Polyangiaceae bacterium]|nr:hypothetical protein [Polyangiaceae bacterium]
MTPTRTAEASPWLLEATHAGACPMVKLGQLPAEAFRYYDCRAGDVLLMKPLLVHRSPRAANPARRRVLHVLYAPVEGWHGRLSRHTAQLTS